MYKCSVCSTVVGPNVPLKVFTTHRTVGKSTQSHKGLDRKTYYTTSPTRQEIAREEPVCQECLEGLCKGMSRRKLSTLNAPKPRVIQVRDVVGIAPFKMEGNELPLITDLSTPGLLDQLKAEFKELTDPAPDPIKCDVCGSPFNGDGQQTGESIICKACLEKTKGTTGGDGAKRRVKGRKPLK